MRALDLVPEAGWRAEGLAVGRARSVPLWPLPSVAAEPGPSGGEEQSESPLPSLLRRLLACLQPPLRIWLEARGVLEWPAQLMPFQLQGVGELLQHEALLLADEMGLGKTVQALAAIRLAALRRHIESCLVVVPTSVFAQWREQFGRWAPELRLAAIRGSPPERTLRWRTPAHAYLVGYETLRADLALARGRIWDLVVLDEAQRIKNAGTEVALAVKRLLRRRAWALTGTPLENRLDDLASLLEFLRPRLAESEVGPIRPLADLRRRLGEVQLRRRKGEVLAQLPPLLRSEILLPPAPAQRQAYERAERQGLVRLRALGSAVRVENVLELIVRLKQLCNVEPVSGESAKLDDLAERLARLEPSGERALVFSQFTDPTFGVAAIARRLTRFRPLQLTGAMSPGRREEVLRRFRDDPSHRVLVLSLRAGGIGLDLQHASYVFLFDRWWNPAVEDQAEGRSHRLGQVRPVHVYAYALEGTVEERVLEVLRDKRELFQEVVEGAGIQPGAGITREELLRIAGLS